MAKAKLRDHAAMVKDNMRRGDRLEERVLRRVRNGAGVITAFRTARSKALFDIVVVQKDKTRLIECKVNGYIEPKRRRALEAVLAKKNETIQVEIWFYVNKKKIRKAIINRPERLIEFSKVRRG